MPRGKKALIVTQYGLWNYGNRLQNYAVSAALGRYGYDSTTLVVRGNPIAHAKDVARNCAHRLGLKGASSRRHKSFVEFDKCMRHVRPITRSQIESYGRHFDLCVLGSDQIWNPTRLRVSGEYFGDFFDPEKVVCVAPSFGVEGLPEGLAPYYRDKLSRLRYLSVREEAGARIVSDLIGVTPPVIVDPTLALDRSEWDEVANSRLVPTEPYIFVYLLGSGNGGVRQSLREHAASCGLRVVEVMNKADESYYAAGPQDFISLVAHASHVYTNSFHACVFSVLYARAFTLLSRMDDGTMTSRFLVFEDRLGVRFVPSSHIASGIDGLYDPETTGGCLDGERDEFYDFLGGAISKIEGRP